MARKIKRSKRIVNAIDIQSRGLGPLTIAGHTTLIETLIKENFSSSTDKERIERWVEGAILRATLDAEDPRFRSLTLLAERARRLDYETVFKQTDRSLRKTGLHRLLFTTDVLFDLMYDGEPEKINENDKKQ